MRSLLAIMTFIMLSASAAQAEKRIFIVANNADGYGVDRCLASGDRCGKAAATAYCKSREFAQASSYRQVDKDEITGAIPANAGGCKGGSCELHRDRVLALKIAGTSRRHSIEFAAGST